LTYGSNRKMPYDDVQEYFRGRYYVSPSTLYSIVRLQPNKQAYDVPVEGDFVIIAVVAERGPIKVSRAPVGLTRDADDDGPGSDDEFADASAARSKPAPATGPGTSKFAKNGKGKGKDGKGADAGPPGTRGGRKFVNLKLVDFGARAASSATGGRAAIRGDALLSLLLFEADRAERVRDPETGKTEMHYVGGSRGAFEHMGTLREGSVVALLNPRVLKPFQASLPPPAACWRPG
jgi:minichromosome maintenance protein 10